MTQHPSPEGAQDEALKLADELERDLCNYPCEAVALVLRRLHADNKALRARVQELELERERAVAAEREACAKLVQDMSHHRRWVRAGINGEPIRPCEYAAAIRASGAQGERNG